MLGRFLDWFARNRTGIGFSLGAAWLSVHAHPAVLAFLTVHPWAEVAVIATAAGIAAAGRFKSDQWQRERQGR